MSTWDTFGAALAAQLAMLTPGSVLIVAESRARSPRYAQFRRLDHASSAELVCESALDESLRAGEAGLRVIAEAGWQAPEDGLPGNWWIDTPEPASRARHRAVAEMVVTGLRDAFGIPAPEALTYRAWNEATGTRALDLPLLGLARA
ncbi:hypothetical protein [Nocardia sp. AG03]|uniref:TY-Chap domain-containing protein n=1 Tax=Nocardia sp. AG03 TaxID=3025312 RepID=UPI002418B80F|nr:hypothetical protein [Nocardia sp. AG03]